jgi:osmotically-inducible protein OsmY
MRTLHRLSLIAPMGVLVMSLNACSSEPRTADVQQQRTTVTTTTTSTAPGYDTAQNVDDLTLSNRVRATLSNTPGVDANMINVEADDGEVTLSGDVPTSSMASAALSATQAVPGVHTVKSDITITNPPQQ